MSLDNYENASMKSLDGSGYLQFLLRLSLLHILFAPVLFSGRRAADRSPLVEVTDLQTKHQVHQHWKWNVDIIRALTFFKRFCHVIHSVITRIL